MNGDDPTTAGLEAVVKAARETALPAILDPDKPVALVIPEQAQVVYPDLHAWRERPSRKTGVYRPATVASFSDYVKRHAAEYTTVWVHPTSGQVTSVIDDNGNEPAWGEHRAELALSTTPEWDYWLAHDQEMLGQEAFAEHIEGGLEEIVTPDAAEMLEIAQSFHATHSAQFRQSNRLSSGEQRLQYDEEVLASAGATGDLTVPTTILLAIAPFLGEDRYRLTARLRFRLNAGKLTLGYWLDRPDAVIRDALAGIADRLAATFPLTYLGTPAPPRG